MADNIQAQWEQATGKPWSNQSWTSYINPVNWNLFAQENPMFTGL